MKTNLYSQWKTHFLNLDQARLFVASKGQGSPVIFLHGGPGDDSTGLVQWAEQFSKYHEVILFDQRGSGQSQISGEYSIENISIQKFVSDLEAVIHETGAATVDLVGHSWGALYAMIFAIEKPKLVSRMALLSCGPISEEFNKVAASNISHGLSDELNEQLKKAREMRTQASESANLQDMRAAQASVVDVLSLRWIYKSAARAEFSQFYRQHHNYDRRVSSILWPQVMEYDLQNKMHVIKAKTLVITGHQDYGSPVQMQMMEKRILNCKLHWLNECGHIPWIDQPEASSQLLHHFLQGPTHRLEKTVFDPIYLETEHVHIRPLEYASWQKVAEGLLYENSFHARNWGVKTPEDLRHRYEQSVLGYRQKRGNPLVFLDISGTHVLGMTNFLNYEADSKTVEIGGTWINPNYLRSYVNTETKLALLEYSFEVLKLHRVEFRIDAENIPSQRAVERLHFHFDGDLPRRRVNANGDSRDYKFYSVTDLSWPEVKKHMQSLLAIAKKEEYPEVAKVKQLRKEKRGEEAYKEIQLALKKYPNSPDLNYLAACICDAERTEKEAVPFYVKALEFGLSGQQRCHAFLGLGSTYRSLGEYEKSQQIFKMGQVEFPNYRPYAVFLALTENNLKFSDQAIQHLLEQLVETTQDIEIRGYERALKFYSTRLHEVFE